MRHLIANFAVYVLLALLVGGSAVFAWIRSSQFVLTREQTQMQRYGDAEAREFDWQRLGPQGYIRNCLNCHDRDGSGWDQYPGLAHTGALFRAPGGREYLIDVHLYGLSSGRWRAPMPPMGHMTDIELAAVMNYMLTEFATDPVIDPSAPGLYTPEEVQSRRNQRLRPGGVNQSRPAVD